MLLNLALHVQNMVARAAAKQSLVNPLGNDFKNAHPLLHDLALYFAGRLETVLGIEVHEGEVDYLSFHMGMQFLRNLEQRDLVTITLVVPRYYDMATSVCDQLQDSVRGQALVEQTVTTIDADFGAVTSDLIVSCIEPGGPASAPVVKISPFLTTLDIDRVLSAVRQERDRNARRRVRTALTTLVDPQLFFHVHSVSSKEAALAMMCGKMVTAGYVEGTFLEDVLDRERRSSTSFGAEFAIPHSMYMDANATAISVMISDKGIPLGRFGRATGVPVRPEPGRSSDVPGRSGRDHPSAVGAGQHHRAGERLGQFRGVHVRVGVPAGHLRCPAGTPVGVSAPGSSAPRRCCRSRSRSSRSLR